MNREPGHVRIHSHDGAGYLFPALDPHTFGDLSGGDLIRAAVRGTSKMCRYGGQILGGVRRPWHALRPGAKSENVPSSKIYTVTQHMVILSHVIEIVTSNLYMNDATRLTLIAQSLIHDCAEGLGIMDMPRPVKNHLTNYGPIEQGIEHLVASQAGVPWPWHALVKTWDKNLCATEKRDLQRSERVDVSKALPLRILPMAPDRAYRAWCKRWAEVKAGTLRLPGTTLWNEVRFILGLQYMTTGEELHGVWTDKARIMPTGGVLA
jgi:hypothetical protein